LRAVLPGEPVIESELEALLSGVVDVRESEQVPAHLARRVIAAILARGVHARDAEGLDALGFRGLAMAHEVEELAIEAAGDAAGELLGVELERGSKARDLVGGERQLARIHPHRVDGSADRERLAVAIRDRAAVCGDVQHAREARRALAGEKAVIDELLIHRAPGEGERPAEEQGEEQARPPAERARHGIPWAARFHRFSARKPLTSV